MKLNNQQQATCNTQTLPVGARTITATYDPSGDLNFACKGNSCINSLPQMVEFRTHDHGALLVTQSFGVGADGYLQRHGDTAVSQLDFARWDRRSHRQRRRRSRLYRSAGYCWTGYLFDKCARCGHGVGWIPIGKPTGTSIDYRDLQRRSELPKQQLSRVGPECGGLLTQRRLVPPGYRQRLYLSLRDIPTPLSFSTHRPLPSRR